MTKMNLNIQERAYLYNRAFPQYPDSHFQVSDRWISSTWIMGNDYRSKRGYYGSYPPGYLKRIWPMFIDCETVLHLFSGSLTQEDAAPPFNAVTLRFDAREELSPDIAGNAEELGLYIGKETTDLIIADPPYSIQDAEHYGTPLCKKKKVLAECHNVLCSGGILLWMDQAIPMYSKKNWKWIGVISMYRSTNHRIRGVMIFEKV